MPVKRSIGHHYIIHWARAITKPELNPDSLYALFPQSSPIINISCEHKNRNLLNMDQCGLPSPSLNITPTQILWPRPNQPIIGFLNRCSPICRPTEYLNKRIFCPKSVLLPLCPKRAIKDIKFRILKTNKRGREGALGFPGWGPSRTIHVINFYIQILIHHRTSLAVDGAAEH